MKKLVLSALALSLVVGFGCGGDDAPADTGPVDTGVDGGNPPDTGTPDTGAPDTGTPDTGLPDTGVPDTGLDGGIPDTGIIDGGEPDGGLPPEYVNYAGQVRKLGAYLYGNTEPNAATNVTPLGVGVGYPPTLSDAQGDFSLQLPANGQVFMWLQKAGYFPTYSKVTTTDIDETGKYLYVAENAWLNEIATAHNVDLAGGNCHAPLNPQDLCQYATIVGRIYDDGAQGEYRPLGGVPRYQDYPANTQAAWSITDSTGNDWYVKGPYFLDYTGTSSVTAYQTVTYDDGQGNYRGGLYVVFVEIPRIVGPESLDLTISIQYPYNNETRYVGPGTAKVFRNNGVSWYSLYQGNQAPPPVNGIDFPTQIYPLFLPVNQGGFGCQGCHTNQGGAAPAGGMNLYGGPDVAYQSLDPATYPQRVNLQNVSASYLLTKPLYEADGVQNHPIFAFASEQDPAYQLIYTWISEGAIGNTQPVVPSFVNDVRPILYNDTLNGGAGCSAGQCHGDPNHGSGFYVGGNAAELYLELTAEAPTNPGPYAEPYRINKLTYPERSLLLTNPLNGNQEPHPIKPFFDNADPRYQLIYQWIAGGYPEN